MNWNTPQPSAAMVSSLWQGIESASILEYGTYFAVGRYDVEIVRCLEKQTKKSGMAFIAETHVIASTNPAHPSGVKRTWFQSMKNATVAHNAVAGFIAAIFGLDNVPVRKADFFPYLGAFMSRVTGPENILSGMYVHVECVQIKTQEENDFTRHDWSPFDFETANREAKGLGMDLNLAPPVWAEYRAPRVALPAGPPPGSQFTPDGRWYLPPGGAQWLAMPSAAVPMPPPPPPAAPPPPPAIPPGAQVSADGYYYLIPGTQVWQRVPGR